MLPLTRSSILPFIANISSCRATDVRPGRPRLPEALSSSAGVTSALGTPLPFSLCPAPQTRYAPQKAPIERDPRETE